MAILRVMMQEHVLVRQMHVGHRGHQELSERLCASKLDGGQNRSSGAPYPELSATPSSSPSPSQSATSTSCALIH